MKADAKMEIRVLSDPEEAAEVEELQRAVWPGSETDVVPLHLLSTLSKNGGVLLGAYLGGTLAGFVLGFIGVDDVSPERVAMARLKHTSHMLGVHPNHRGKGIGLALKLAQRRLVLDQGIRLVTWMYDPLLSRNAHLNIRRLGALCRRYLPEAYGEMRDAINVGVASDRFEVEWWITSPRVVTRIEGSRPPVDLANILAAGVVKVNPATLGSDDLPRPSEETLPLEGNLVLVEIPPDFDVMKGKDPALAQAWRLHTRDLFTRAFSLGYIVSDFVHLSEETHPRSYYLLIQGEGTLGP
jgi:predicted GNAT superfamily acetyltransferase